jgi:pimeloyl-ACP methyl ester carboxylesterase
VPTARTPDGVAVAYTDLGGDGPPVLFAHATGFHGHVWRPVVEHLGARFRCVVFDERGHGDTPPAEDGQSWHGFALDALAVVDDAGLERPFGVGHSAGGAALLLAELARPGTFRGLWCFEPILPPTLPGGAAMPGSRANPLAEGARRRREVFPSKDAAFENYAGKLPFSVLDPAALRAYVDFGFAELEDGTVRLKCRRDVEAATYEMAVRHGAVERLEEVGCPVVLASGGRTDTPFGPDLMAQLATRLPAGRAEPFPDLGHFGPLEDPTAIAASIRRAFLSPPSPSSPAP